MAPMGQFEHRTVRVVKRMEPSVLFCGERGRFAIGQGSHCTVAQIGTNLPLRLQINMISIADLPNKYGSRVAAHHGAAQAYKEVIANSHDDKKKKHINLERARAALWALYAL